MGRAVRKLRAWCRREQACSSRESGWASHACWPVNSWTEEEEKAGGREKRKRGGSQKKRKEGKKMRKRGKRKEKRGKAFFGREIGEESVRFDYLLLHLILFLRITLRFLHIFRWLLWLPKEANLFLTFVYLIFAFSSMSCMLDIFCVWVLSSLRSSHQSLLKALLVFVMQSLVLVVLSPLYILLCPSSFFCSFLFLHLSPLFLAFSGEEIR